MDAIGSCQYALHCNNVWFADQLPWKHPPLCVRDFELQRGDELERQDHEHEQKQWNQNTQQPYQQQTQSDAIVEVVTDGGSVPIPSQPQCLFSVVQSSTGVRPSDVLTELMAMSAHC